MSRFVLTVAVCAAGASAPVGAEEPLANVGVSGGNLVFQPLGLSNGGLVLTVSGPADFHFKQALDDGGVPFFQPFDASGAALPDGGYTWELRARPSLHGQLAKMLETARASGDTQLVRDLRAQGLLPQDAAAQSGSFLIVGGSIAVPTEDPEVSRSTSREPSSPLDYEQPVTNDQQILDDLIVDGSLCVGFDCVNGESFGFDTIRLKENNVRINFQDTSNSASFPTRDWRIVINDTSNGGGSYFAVEDSDAGRQPFRIDGDAKANSLRVGTGGRVGFGTASPAVALHSVNGNTPTLRLDQDGSNGFQSQTWDVAGNEANFFVRDATNGSRLPFKIKPGAPDNALFVAASGNVGLGTASPSVKLDVQGSLNVGGGGAFDGDVDVSAGNVNITDGQLVIEGTTGDATVKLKSPASTWVFQANQAQAGALIFRNNTNNVIPMRIFPGSAQDSLRIDASGVTILGTPVPDFVFEPDYELESIEEHADYMFTHKHLPAVGAGRHDEHGRPILEVGSHSFGVLEELEKAHIYISQLNDAVADKDSRIRDLEQRLERLEVLLRGAAMGAAGPSSN